MLLVVFGHSLNFWNGKFVPIEPAVSADVLVKLFDFIYSFHIYGFTLVSGYLFCYLVKEKHKYVEFIPFVVNKIKRLLVPYIFVCIIWVIPIAEIFFQYSINDLINKYFLGTSPNQLWFLLMLFWVFIISWLLRRLYQNHFLTSGIVVSGLYVGGIVGNHFLPNLNIYCVWNSLIYTVFFWVGFQMLNHYDSFAKIRWYIWTVCFIALFLITEVVSFPGYISTPVMLLLHILGAIGSFEVLQVIASKVNWKQSKLWGLLTKESMPIYLFHQQLLYFTIYWLNGLINPYLNAAVNFAFALTVSVWISGLLMRFKATKFLIGAK